MVDLRSLKVESASEEYVLFKRCMQKELVRIKESSGKITNLIEDRKSIIHYLPLTLKVIRLYAVGADEKKVKEIKAEVKSRL